MTANITFISLEGVRNYTTEIPARAILEELSSQTSPLFKIDSNEANLWVLRNRAIFEIGTITHIVDFLLDLIFCGGYQTTTRKIDRLYHVIHNSLKVAPAKAKAAEPAPKQESPPAKAKAAEPAPKQESQPAPVKQNEPKRRGSSDIKIKPKKRPVDMSPMAPLSVEVKPPYGRMTTDYIFRQIKEMKDVFGSTEAEYLKENLSDWRFIQSECLGRSELLRILGEIRKKVEKAFSYQWVVEMIDKAVMKIERFELQRVMERLRHFDVDDVRGLIDFLLEEENGALISKQVGNIELYDVLYQINEDLEQGRALQESDSKDRVQRALFKHMNAIRPVSGEMLPNDVWRLILSYAIARQRSKGFLRQVARVSKKMLGVTQSYIANWIQGDRICLIKDSCDKKGITNAEAVAYTIKYKINYIHLHEYESNDLTKLLEGRPDIKGLMLINNFRPFNYSALYQFTNLTYLKVRSRSGLQELDLDNFPELEEIDCQGGVTLASDNVRMKKLVVGYSKDLDVSKFKTLEVVKLSKGYGRFQPIHLVSPNLREVVIDAGDAKEVSITPNATALTHVEINGSKISKLSLPRELPFLTHLEISTSKELSGFDLPQQLPRLKDLKLHNLPLTQLDLTEKLSLCESIGLYDLEKLSEIRFPRSAPFLRKYSNFGVNAIVDLELPEEAPRIEEIYLNSMRQLNRLALPAQPKPGASIRYDYLGNGFDWSAVPNVGKYKRSDEH